MGVTALWVLSGSGPLLRGLRGQVMNGTRFEKSLTALLLSIFSALFLSLPARAADDNPDNAQDPPSRVARISYINGSVSLQPGGTGDWGAAAKNRPMTIGDKLWVDQNARAELEVGELSIHLGSMTALSFLNLDGNVTQIRLAEGHINFRIREMREGDSYEVDTPNVAFTVHKAGAFRIDVGENGDATSVTVIRGEGEVAGGGQTLVVEAGQQANIDGNDASVKISSEAAPPPDDLDQWAQSRDLKEENSPSARYVNRDTVGYSDLDDYGTWNEEPNYGAVWYPNSVEPGWSPYSSGYWNWVGPWGWTWIDYSPWGFAPFHYGRWIYGGGRWGWCPGPYYARPFYGPAFVGFVGGFGAGFGFGVGFGAGFGWFPLGWGEPYHPWYHCGSGYYHNVNVYNTHITNVNTLNSANHNYNYAYAHNANAVTVASHNAFVNGQAIHGSTNRLTSAALHGAQVNNSIAASPNRSSYFGAANSHGNIATPPVSTQSRSVVARTAPAAAASHLPVHTMNTAQLRPAQVSHTTASNRSYSSSPSQTYTGHPALSNSNRTSAASTAPTRSWNAQGNVTDSGRAPQGFGAASSSVTHTTSPAEANRPPWARSGASAGSYQGGNSTSRSASVNRPPASYNSNNANRPPAANRSYTPPPRPSSAPHYGSPAPHSSGGGSSHASGGGSPHGGGGHPSGGGGGHPGGGGGGGSHHR